MAVTVFSQLDKSLHSHLATLTDLAQRGDDQTALVLARVDEHGRCATCKRGWFSRRLPAPCRAYLSAQLILTVVGQETSHGKHLRSVG